MTKKFVLVTRGRTGSTAIIDELSKCNSVIATHELFQRNTFTEKALKNNFGLLPPFDLWKQADWWRRLFSLYGGDARQARKYLRLLEKSGGQQEGVLAVGWKVLSHHFEQRPYLYALLRDLGYQAVYLRRNIASQVLSGMVAGQRGIYNSKERIVDKKRYVIDVEEFKWHVKWERKCVEADGVKLQAEGLESLVVNYENYCGDRVAFYIRIFEWLDLPLELPPSSDYQKMIDDPMGVIENYEEVVSAAAAVGEPL